MYDERLIGKCGFFCKSCPTYASGACEGCLDAQKPGDCFTRDCVIKRNISYCGLCTDFPCDALLKREKATVLDREWLIWKRAQRSNRK